MIREILDTLKNKLEEYLTAYFNSPEGYVQIGGIPVGSDNAPNKLSLSVVNLERETTVWTSHKSLWSAYPLGI